MRFQVWELEGRWILAEALSQGEAEDFIADGAKLRGSAEHSGWPGASAWLIRLVRGQLGLLVKLDIVERELVLPKRILEVVR